MASGKICAAAELVDDLCDERYDDLLEMRAQCAFGRDYPGMRTMVVSHRTPHPMATVPAERRFQKTYRASEFLVD